MAEENDDTKEREEPIAPPAIMGGGPMIVAGAEGAEASDAAPAAQLGVQRFVYAAFMAGAILVAFLLAKITDAAWRKIAQFKPAFGEPQEEAVYVVSALLGVGLAFYTWRRREARNYVEEVASELSKVTWPSKKEVTNSTFVVVMTTLVATTFFALMDQFWRFVTDHVYAL
jgi:preprotein translocase subunit SecE